MSENLDGIRLEGFIESLQQDRGPILEAIRARAIEDGVPIIRSETENLLRFLVMTRKPKKILEVGCAIGYSALVMHTVAQNYGGCHITTMESYEPRIEQARANFAAAGAEAGIELLTGDATPYLTAMQPDAQFDLIFLDAAKAQYVVWLPNLLRLLKSDGLLVTDNILTGGDILESRFAVTRRNRTIHTRMREFLEKVTHDPALTSAVLSSGDGVCLTSKIQVPD
ncbi:MAG: O-methyltransferase [Lachnospiraceae bacterium]|nr:O-methyltransferase [Lachnospiraceae bacterium]